jgi:NAD(P)-dependent dehydrogenase (short-subunit alcohol dehydrogenase family)
MSLTKGIALITGSSQGIGRGIALRLAKDGFDIALNDVSSKRDQLRAIADDVEKIGQKSVLVPTDVAVEEEVKGMVQEVVKGLRGLDVVSTSRSGTRNSRIPLTGGGKCGHCPYGIPDIEWVTVSLSRTLHLDDGALQPS